MDIADPTALVDEAPRKRVTRSKKGPEKPPLPQIPTGPVEVTPPPPMVHLSTGEGEGDEGGEDQDGEDREPNPDLHEPNPGLPPERAPSVERPPRQQYDVTLARTAPPP